MRTHLFHLRSYGGFADDTGGAVGGMVVLAQLQTSQLSTVTVADIFVHQHVEFTITSMIRATTSEM